MNYLSTSEIAKKWGVSRKTVTRYAVQGKISDAKFVGRTWMIPADAEKDGAEIEKVDERSGQAKEFHFPLYIYRDFFNLKDSLKKPEELQLYTAFESILKDDFNEAYRIAQQITRETEDLPIKITCLYVMCRCCFYLKKYPCMMKYSLEMSQILAEDIPYKKEMETLIIDIESYYKGFDSLLRASFDSSYEYSTEVYPIITTMSLYRQIIKAFREKSDIDPTAYELILRDYEDRGYVFPCIMLCSELAFIYQNKKQELTAYRYIRKGYELTEKYHGYVMFIDICLVCPKLVKKALNSYGITISEDFKKHFKSYKQAYLGLLAYLKIPKSIISFSSDDILYISYAIKKYTNKEIAAEMHISENAICQRYAKLCRSFSVDTKSELVNAFLLNLESYSTIKK